MISRPRRPPRDVLRSLDNKENQPDLPQRLNRPPQFRITKIAQVLTECNSTSASRARTPVRGRQLQVLQFKEKSHSQKNYDQIQEPKRYMSTKESVQQYQTIHAFKNEKLGSINNRHRTLAASSREIQLQDHLLRLLPATCDPLIYQMGPMIGKGSYAVVKLGTDHNARKVALKIYEKSLLKGERLNNLVKEVNTLRQLNHEQIVKLYDVFHQGNHVVLVLEYCGTESLYTLLKGTSHRCVSKELAFSIMHQLLKILFHMHDRHICHRDIKLENVLVGGNKKIKLIDFGFSTFSNQAITCHCGTPSYMAPEVIQKLKYDGRQSDIWALGVLFVCLIQGSFPFKGQNERELFKKIRNNEYFVASNDRDVRYFLNQIFILDPTQRATAKELLQLDIFRNMQ